MKSDGEDMMFDRVLIEFPIFSLNEDYLRAIVNVIYSKVDIFKN